MVFGVVMQYKAKALDRDTGDLARELEPVVLGLGFALVELSLYRSGRKKTGKNNAQIRLIVTGKPEAGLPGDKTPGIGTDELSRIHRAVLPRLELALEGADLHVEVSSPGTDRLVKEGAEFCHYTGRAIKCWRKDKWEQGILRSSDEEKITLETAGGMQEMKYETIAKARLDG